MQPNDFNIYFPFNKVHFCFAGVRFRLQPSRKPKEMVRKNQESFGTLRLQWNRHGRGPSVGFLLEEELDDEANIIYWKLLILLVFKHTKLIVWEICWIKIKLTFTWYFIFFIIFFIGKLTLSIIVIVLLIICWYFWYYYSYSYLEIKTW